jgi:hypothetical protein
MDEPDRAFELVVLADWTPGREGSGRLTAIDKDSLDQFIEKSAPSCAVDGGTISFTSFKDFRPERLAARLPALASLRVVRAQALDLAAGKGTWDALQTSLQGLSGQVDWSRKTEPAAPPTRPPPAPTGDVFDLVDVADAGPTSSPAQGLINAVLGRAPASGPSPADLRGIAARADQAIAPLLRHVLRDPAFRRLEESWRGLRWLVRSLDFRSGVRVSALSTSRTGLSNALREIVLPYAEERRSQGVRVGLVLDFTFDPLSEANVVDLARAADVASDVAVPVLASAAVGRDVASLAESLAGPAAAAWLDLRSRESSRWLALAVNGFLLRLPYGKQADPVKDFDFEENSPETPPQYLIGQPAWLVAALVASSFARTGWGVDFAGQSSANSLESLPVRPHADSSGDPVQIPLLEHVRESAARQLLDAGLLPLVCRSNSDRAFAAGASAVHRDGAAASSWRQAWFAAHLGVSIQGLLGSLDPSRSLEEIGATFRAGLELLGLSEEGQAAYTVEAIPSAEGRPSVSLTVRPSGALLRGLSPFRMDVPIPLH